jgi:uncharacterized protein (TIGR00106 family)
LVELKVIADYTIIPIGHGPSVSAKVAIAVKLIRESGLKHQLHPYGTILEGNWDEVMNVVKKCHEVLHADGVERIHSALKIGTRTDKKQSATDKLKRIEDHLNS